VNFDTASKECAFRGSWLVRVNDSGSLPTAKMIPVQNDVKDTGNHQKYVGGRMSRYSNIGLVLGAAVVHDLCGRLPRLEQAYFLATEYGGPSLRAKNLQRGTYGSVHAETAGRRSAHTNRDALWLQTCDRWVVVKRMFGFKTLHHPGLGIGLTERVIGVHAERRCSCYLKVVGKVGRWTIQGPRLCMERRYLVIPAEHQLSDAGHSSGICYGLPCDRLGSLARTQSRLETGRALLARWTVCDAGHEA